MQDNDMDYDYARRLQLIYNQESIREFENNNRNTLEDDIEERDFLFETTPITNNSEDEQQNNDDSDSNNDNSDINIDNDYAIALQLQEEYNGEVDNEVIPRMNRFVFGRYETNLENDSEFSDTPIVTPHRNHGRYGRNLENNFRMNHQNSPIESNRSHYSEDLNDEDEDLDDVTQKISSIEINSHDLKTIIIQFKAKLIQKHPGATRKTIRLSTRNQDLMFLEFIEALRQFKEIDFIHKPKIEFKNEPVVDAGGAFNDTVRQILDMFMSLQSPEYGGNGQLFTGDDSKLISSTAPISVMDELNIFGDILFLAIIHDSPFPIDLDIILFKYCLDLENTITLKDVERFSPVMYNLAREVLNSNPDVDLSTIDGFNEWAEDKEISAIQKQVYSRTKENLRKLAKEICHDVLIHNRIKQLNAIKLKLNKFGFLNVIKEKQIKIEEVKDYFYQENITCDDILRKLVFSPSNLSRRQNTVKNWFIEWLRAQRKEELQEFCKLTTGFINPREVITVAFKVYIVRENREAALTPRFSTCFFEVKLSELFSSKHELFAIMNAQVNKNLHDDRFTVA